MTEKCYYACVGFYFLVLYADYADLNPWPASFKPSAFKASDQGGKDRRILCWSDYLRISSCAWNRGGLGPAG